MNLWAFSGIQATTEDFIIVQGIHVTDKKNVNQQVQKKSYNKLTLFLYYKASLIVNRIIHKP